MSVRLPCRVWLTIFAALLLPSGAARAWGPHPEITKAALAVLTTNDALFRQLGPIAVRLTNYAWMADYRKLPFEEGAELFYADDYLLFPEVITHFDHILPEVKQTYRPYFKRALQALRTENPVNAARWIGSLLHFAEDTGSPPHAAQLRGDVHTKMENWVDAERIAISPYAPALLGRTDEDALNGFNKRMDELIEFSKSRARRLQVPVGIGDRTAAKPIVLESALETSRMTADLLHTLGWLAQTNFSGSASLRGRILSRPGPGALERFPAKIVLHRTAFSTLADTEGRFEFRNLPPATYTLSAFRPGSPLITTSVVLVANQTVDLNVALPRSESNLIRNGDFKLEWAKVQQPDCWYRAGGSWEGEIIPLKIGQRYRLTADFKENSNGEVLVRWTRYLPHAVPRNAPIPKIQTRTLTRDIREFEFTAAETLGLLQLVLNVRGHPETALHSVRLVAVEEK